MPSSSKVMNVFFSFLVSHRGDFFTVLSFKGEQKEILLFYISPSDDDIYFSWKL